MGPGGSGTAQNGDHLAERPLLDEVLTPCNAQQGTHGRVGSIDRPQHLRLDLPSCSGRSTSTTSPISSRCTAYSIAIGTVYSRVGTAIRAGHPGCGAAFPYPTAVSAPMAAATLPTKLPVSPGGENCSWICGRIPPVASRMAVRSQLQVAAPRSHTGREGHDHRPDTAPYASDVAQLPVGARRTRDRSDRRGHRGAADRLERVRRFPELDRCPRIGCRRYRDA